jgi:lysophospholipase L1-like esterase
MILNEEQENKSAEYDAIVIIAGTNDIGNVKEIKDTKLFVENLFHLAKLPLSINQKSLSCLFYFFLKLNQVLEKLCDIYKFEYCEFFEYLNSDITEEDGLHLNKEGKKICCEMLTEIINTISNQKFLVFRYNGIRIIVLILVNRIKFGIFF